MIKRALISVYDKTGIVEFAKELHKLGVEIIATGGTTKLLNEYEIPAKHISDVTKFPEILGGRVKTEHPKLIGGILALRDKEEHMKDLKKLGIKPVDMVISNLYPFEEVTSEIKVDLAEALENIDIGGPNMIRAAAKNFENVVVIVDPDRYDQVLEELKKNGDLSIETRSRLAIEAFKATAKYDWVIHKFLETQKLSSEDFPETLNLRYKKIKDLRYGENPHQKAAFYKELELNKPSVVNAKQLWGKELSWTNVLDLNTALELVKEFEEPSVAIIKHTSPCGVACGSTLFDAFEKAYASDPISAFGGVLSTNRKIDLNIAKRMALAHFDCIIAPEIDEDALEALKGRKSLRILKTGELSHKHSKHLDIVNVVGGLLVQEHNSNPVRDNFRVVTKTKPSSKEMKSLKFAWKVAKYVKSNAIVLAKDKRTVGIGLGQTSRVGAAKIAIEKAGKEAKNSVMASDGFFPFRDSIDEAAKVGVKAIIQPGGSIRDKEVVDAANEHGISMVFTGIRCFRH